MARKKKQPVFTLEQKQAADIQIKESQKQIDYDTKDYTIELLISKFNKGDFFIPPYQRKFVWKEKNKNLFLESIFLGLPILNGKMNLMLPASLNNILLKLTGEFGACIVVFYICYFGIVGAMSRRYIYPSD